MSDPNRYINVYVENALGMVHEYINMLLQHRTQAKLMEETIKDRELDIARLTEEVTQLRQNNTNVTEAMEKVRVWEEKYNSMKQQVAHMDTMASSFNDMKKRLIEKNTEVDQIATETQEIKKVVIEKDRIIDDLNRQLKPFLKEIKVAETKKPATKKIEEKVEPEKVETPALKKGAIRLSQLKVQKEEEQTDDF